MSIIKISNTSKGQSVSWTSVQGASSYQLMCSERENGSYKKAAQADNAKTTLTVKATKGRTYYYKVRAIFSDGSYTESESYSKYYPKTGVKKMAVKVSSAQTIKEGQYSEWMNWSCADETYYYVKDNKRHVVTIQANKLYDYTLTSKLKIKSKKVVDIAAHDTWGAFYYGEDGNYYVAVGYINDEEDPEKTVIRVSRYDASWKNRRGWPCMERI